MPELPDLSSPVMRAAARFHRDPAARLRGEEADQPGSTDPLAELRSAGCICTVHMKNLLCEIQADVVISPMDTSLRWSFQHHHLGT